MNTSKELETTSLYVIGCGDAFSKTLGSSAYLFWRNSERNNRVLFDCGYQTPATLFGADGLHSNISTVIISHFHADHVFGLPILLTYWTVRKRRSEPLIIMGPSGIESFVEDLCDKAYPGVRPHRQFKIEYQEIAEAQEVNGYRFEFAQTLHSVESYSLRVATKNSSFAISGDGAATEDSLRLYRKTEHLIHEAFGLEGTMAKHDYLIPLIEKLADSGSLKRLLLTHMKEEEHERCQRYIESRKNELKFSLALIKPGEKFYF